MSDRVRGALFNVLGDVEGLTVLDPFAGTGALSFEAISRGAKSAVAIESFRRTQTVLAENVASLGLEEVVQVERMGASVWLKRNADETFDVVLCDPPYNDIDPSLLRRLADRVNPHGVLVISWPGREEHMEFKGFQLVQAKNYGDAKLLFYHRI